MFTAILFDLYETLITQFEPDWKPPKRSMAARLGISEEDHQRHWSQLFDHWRRGSLGSYRDFLRELCRTAGHAPSESVIAELAMDNSRRKSIAFTKTESAIAAMVQQLGSQGFRLGIVTNAGDMDVESWPCCRLAPFFEVFVPSFQVGILKPDPRIFDRALQELGVSAQEAVFVGDGGSDELSGAKRVGLTPLWATWFLDRWPPGIRPDRVKGDEWRQFPGGEPPFPRLHNPPELLDWLSRVRS